MFKSRIAESGITPVVIRDQGDPLDGDGNVLFCAGALLDVDFVDEPLQGEWDVMRWEGTLVDYGLRFAPSVDTSVWRFAFVDTDGSGRPDTLRVTAGEHQPIAETPTSRLKLNALFDDAMVLQRDVDAPVWGSAPAGAEVTLHLDGALVATVTADATGSWQAGIGTHSGDGGKPHTLTVATPGEPEVVLSEVVFGDVYLCSGQSNMDRTLSGLGLGADIVEANHPMIRQIKMKLRKSSVEQDEAEVEYTWTRCSSPIAGEFTATGYFFAQRVQATTGEPVGLLFSAWGGRPIREFIAPEGLNLVPELDGVQFDIERRVLTHYSSNYHAMIAPLAPYAIRGALWYQGEADAGRLSADLYRFHLQALVRGWRAKWGQERFSFYYVQLPNFETKADWPRFREAQQRFLTEPDTGMAVTLDIGDDRDIHPTNKMDVGYRLAALALENDLGVEVQGASPFFAGVRQYGDRLQVGFTNAENGLVVATKDGRTPPQQTEGALQNMEVAGADGHYQEAEVRVEGSTIWASSPKVPRPVYVRYGWANAPEGANRLYGRSGLPAAPFRNTRDYEITVSGGEGSATGIDVGEMLTISAAVELKGKPFVRWVGGGEAVKNPSEQETQVLMPNHDLYVVPVYH